MTGGATATPTGSFAHASTNISSSFADATGLGPAVVLLLYVVGALLAAQFVAPWLAQSELLSDVAGGLVASAEYAVKGVGATAVLLVGALPVYFLATADGGTQGLALEAVGVLLAGYIALVGIGMLADRAVTAFIDAHPDVDEWGDLFPEDESTEAVPDGGESDA